MITNNKTERLHSLFKPALICLLAFLVVGCDEKSIDYDFCLATQLPEEVELPEPDVPNGTTPVTSPETLSGAMTFDDAIRREGDLSSVVPSSNLGGGLNATDQITVADNSASSISITPTLSTSGSRIAAVFVQLDGADEFFIVPVSASSVDPDGTVTINLLGPSPDNPASGALIQTDTSEDDSAIFATAVIHAFVIGQGDDQPDFSGDTWANQTNPDNWTALTTMDIDTAIVAVGEVSITLSWDTAGTDLDLWVTEPDDHRIWWVDKQSAAGDGFLDRDDVDGYGPENILFQSDIPTGRYTIQVNYYSGNPVTNYTISVAACGGQLTRTGTVSESGGTAGELDTVYILDYAPGCVLQDTGISGPSLRERTVGEQAQCHAYETALADDEEATE